MNSILRNLKILLVLLALGAASYKASATHIAGGEITYERLGGDTFELTLRLSFFCGGAPGSFPTAAILNSAGGLAQTAIKNTCNTTTIATAWVAVDTVLVTPI